MAFCPNCGANLKDGAKFCAGCGQAQTPPAAPLPAQQTENIQSQPQAQPARVNKKIKPPIIIGGIAGVGVIALVMVLIFTNMFGLLNKKGGFGGIGTGGDMKENINGTDAEADGSGDSGGINVYQIFGDGNLIKAPQRLKAAPSADDGVSAAALIGPWKGYRNSVTTEYGFSDDGYFYKNVMITHAHLNSNYHSGYYSGDYYYYGYWTYNTTYTYTYLDTVVGEYKIKGGILELFHIFTTERTIFEDDWFYGKTRSIDIGQLQARANSARYNDNILMEFEFINSARIRLRTESEDMDLFWDIEDDPHNVPVPKHEIPPVDWPAKALSADMPLFNTKGRMREASLSYSGDDKNIKAEYKTVTVVIDKAGALSEINSYGKNLKNSGWWVDDYELGEEDNYLSYESRKGMFKLNVSNGRGSGTSEDTIVIESVKYQEGVWPKVWTEATLVMPDNAAAVGIIDIETGVDINVYESIIFDKVNESGAAAYKNKLAGAGFKKPQYSSDDEWDMMKYVRIEKDLYLARVKLDKRMDSLSSFTYDLSYVEDGVWPESWKTSGLPAPEGYDTIAGAIDKNRWDESMADYSSEYVYVKFLNLSKNGIDAYMSKLKSVGFIPVKDWDGNDTNELYNYLRIEGRMIRAEVSLVENEDITEIRYIFDCHKDGEWPAEWLSGGLPAPDKYETIIDIIDLDRWNEDITGDWGGSSYMYVKYLNMTAGDVSSYITKLKNAGFIPVRDWDGNDTDELYNYLRIDNKLYRIGFEQRDNRELAEFLYKFEYYEDGVWPAIWQSDSLPAPDKYDSIVGAIDLDRWNEDITGDWGGSSYVYIKYLGMTAADISSYMTKLKNVGFKAIKDWDGNDTDELYYYPRIDGKLYRVTIERRENNELTELLYKFEYYEDGEWPSQWTSAGIPAPSFTAMPGKIDMTKFNENLNDWGSSSEYIKLLGANLSDYAATLKKSGFTEPEYNYSDTWELSKRLQINGQWCNVTIEDRNNKEIPEIYIYFRNE